MVEKSPFHLLLVEDNPGDADLAYERLSSVPEYVFNVTHVTTLAEASRELNARLFDVMILDLNLSDSYGISTLQHLRSQRDDVAIVVLSGSPTDELRRLAYREGAQDFIGKDEPPAKLLARSVLFALERHRAQERQSQIQKLISANPDAVVVVDANGIILFANESALELFGKRREEFVGESLGFVAREGRTAAIEIQRDGEKRNAEMRTSLCEWAGKIAYLTSIRDTTEQVKLAEQYRQAQKMEAIGRLAGGVAHDFNNLLTVISGYAEILMLEAGDNVRMTDKLNVIYQASVRAASLVRQLLLFSRKSNPSPVALDLNALISELEKMLRRLIGEDIELKSVLDPSLSRTKADPSQIEQVVMNLVVNARDAMPEGGSLVIETRNVVIDPSEPGSPVDIEAGAYVLLSVTDEGEGMTEETLSHIFEPFFTTKEVGKGTGLGLATVYGIVKQNNGSLSVFSEPGEGSRFMIYLPMLEASGDRDDESPSLLKALTGDETILLVEDESDVRGFIQIILESNGYHLLEARDGLDALRIAENYREDIPLLLTDVVMPHLNGPSLAQRLAESRPEMKILYISGYTDDALMRYDLVHSRASLLEKPFNPSELLLAVREILDRKSASHK